MSESALLGGAELFDGGPSRRLERSLGRIRPADPGLRWPVATAVLVGWVPLAILSAAQGYAWNGHPRESFLLDPAAHARWLVAVPLLIVAGRIVTARMSQVAGQMLAAGVVTDHERARYDAIVASTRRLLDARWAEIGVVIAAFAQSLAVSCFARPEKVSTWVRPLTEGAQGLSIAGWWRALVSLPLFLALLYGWLWRLLVWARYLWQVAHLELRLVPAHPDQVGGLAFVNIPLRALALLGFALTASAAGAIANRVVYDHVNLQEYQYAVAALVIVILGLFLGPLLPLCVPLHRAKIGGLLQYGALASGVGEQFQRKWLVAPGSPAADSLEAPDFSATTDLFQVVNNVRQMKTLPFDRQSVAWLLAAMLLPFVPVALTVVPLKRILEVAGKLLVG